LPKEALPPSLQIEAF